MEDMDIDPGLLAPPARAKKTPARRNTVMESACVALLDKFSFTPKQFLENFLTSSVQTVMDRRNAWFNENGWPSTQRCLDKMKGLVYSHGNKVVREKYEEWIYREVSNGEGIEDFLVSSGTDLYRKLRLKR